MKSIVCFLSALAVVAPGVLFAQSSGKTDGLAIVAALFEEHHEPEASGPALTLEEVERIALAANPEIAVAARRVAIAQAHVPTAGALDDPMAMYRGWGVPLQSAVELQPGAKHVQHQPDVSRGRASGRYAPALRSPTWTWRRLSLSRFAWRFGCACIKRSMICCSRKTKCRIHDQHVEIARQAIEAARIKYTTGKVPQQDILKAQVALTALAEHMIRFDQDADLGAGPSEHAVGPKSQHAAQRAWGVRGPGPAAPGTEPRRLGSSNRGPICSRPRQAAERSHKEQALAKKAYVPDFTVSAGYMIMPSGQNMRNAYMVEGSMNLPWLNHRKHDAEIAEATVQATEQDAELTALRNAAFGQIQEALVEAEAAQKLAHMYHDQLRPQAEATLQSSVIAYENDKTDFLDLLDSQMTVINIDLAWLQAVADFDTRLADLELATGTPLNQSDRPRRR